MKKVILFLILVSVSFKSYSQVPSKIADSINRTNAGYVNSAGLHLNNAGTYALIGYVSTGLGIGISLIPNAINSNTGEVNKTPQYIGLGFIGAGVIFQFVAWGEIIAAGNRLQGFYVSPNRIGYKF